MSVLYLPTPIVTHEPDHELIELGRRFKDALPVEMAAVADEIRDVRATTPKGLAIKAEVLAWRVAASSHGRPSADLESSYDHLFSLIRAVCEVAGEPLPGFVAEALRWRP